MADSRAAVLKPGKRSERKPPPIRRIVRAARTSRSFLAGHKSEVTGYGEPLVKIAQVSIPLSFLW
jgi:hypothetical protein